jgi:hypothetical protein
MLPRGSVKRMGAPETAKLTLTQTRLSALSQWLVEAALLRASQCRRRTATPAPGHIRTHARMLHDGHVTWCLMHMLHASCLMCHDHA